MIENQRPQEKLLTMLTEIYDQLEELEAVLEHSLTDLRGNLSQQQTSKLSVLDHDLGGLEHAFKDVVEVNKIQNTNQHHLQKNLKLELGF